MLLPESATAVWVTLVVSLICWGSWASLFKGAKKARFEFFAYDFSLGVILAALVAAFTLGSWNNRDLTFQDNFILVGIRKMSVAFASGFVFSIANTMLLGAIAVAGMSAAFPIVFGLTWAILAVLSFKFQPNVNAMLSIGGGVAVVVAGILSIVAHRWYLSGQQSKEPLIDPRKNASQSGRSFRAIGLAILSGIFFSIFFVLLERATVAEVGLAPYSAALMISAGIFFASLLIVPFFLNFPIKGQPLTVSRYFKIEKRHHFLGILAGVVWTGGLLAGLAAEVLPSTVVLSPIAAYMMTHAAPLLAVLWGLLVWREKAGASTGVHMMTAAMFVLLLVGMGMIAAAPVYGH